MMPLLPWFMTLAKCCVRGWFLVVVVVLTVVVLDFRVLVWFLDGIVPNPEALVAHRAFLCFRSHLA